MSLRDDITRSPRGIQSRLVAETGLSKPTVIAAMKGTACTARTAQAIAEAFGAPDCWPELVVVSNLRAHDITPQEPAA